MLNRRREYDIEITKQGPPRGPGRRREEEDEGGEEKVGPGWPWPKPPPLTVKECRCPYCNYRIVVEEGARCLNSVCPHCGHRMVEV